MFENKKGIIPITSETTLQNAKQWLNIIRFSESGTVIQLQDDCEYRILEIITNTKILKSILGPYYRKYLLKYIPIDQKDLHKSINVSLVDLCIERKIGSLIDLSKLTNQELLSLIAEKGYEIGLFISHIKPILAKSDFQALINLELLIRTNKKFSVIVFSEVDITHTNYDLLVDKASFLFDHIIKYPLYDEKDSIQFANYYCSQWDLTLPINIISEIYQYCNGYLWLIHHAVRNLRDNPDMSVEEAVNDELMMRKLEVIWSKFTQDEKEILRKVSFGSLLESETLSHEYEYLEKIRIIKRCDGRTILNIPLLSKVVEKENRLNKLRIIHRKIFIGKNEITSRLTVKEKAFLLLLLSSKKKIISRDVIALNIWGKDWEEKYSDWAIDRLAHRIRKKMRSLGIDDKFLRTVKKKGFIFG